MKLLRPGVFLVFIFLTGNLSSMSDPDSLFIRANKLYQEGSYEEAAELYLQIDSTGLQSAEVYYNAGNAFFRSNKLGKARLYYEKALLVNPSDKDTWKNLEYLESMLADRFDEVPVFFLRKWMNSLFNMFHPDTWAIISLAMFVVFVLAFMLYIISKKTARRKTGFYTGIVFILLSLMSLLVARRNTAILENPGTAIIMEGSQVVRSAPRQSGKELFILHEGSKVWIERGIAPWFEVRIADGRKGWVPAECLEAI